MKQPVRLLKINYSHKKCAWRESNPRQTRFRKPPLYPTELQAHICLFNFIFNGDGSVRQPASIAYATLLRCLNSTSELSLLGLPIARREALSYKRIFVYLIVFLMETAPFGNLLVLLTQHYFMIIHQNFMKLIN